MSKKVYHINSKSFRLTEAFNFDDEDKLEDDNYNAAEESLKKQLRFLKQREAIKAFLDFYGIQNYTISEDGIFVDGLVDLSSMHLKVIPYKFHTVNGSFNISFNELTSLKNSPDIVRGNFNCNYNKIKSFEGAPRIVEGIFYGEKQKYGKNIKLSDEFFKEWNNNGRINESTSFSGKVKLVETEMFGDLQSINEDLQTCTVKLETGEIVKNVPTDKVEVLEALKELIK